MPGSSRLVAILFAVVLVASCGDSAGLTAGGPLGPGGTSGRLCLPSIDGTATVAIDALTASEPVSIEAVRLQNAADLAIIDASVVVVPRTTLIGAHDAYPPNEIHADAPSWSDRVPARGATLQPGETWNLILGVKVEGKRGTADAVEVQYTNDGNAHRYLATTELDLRRRPTPCD